MAISYRHKKTIFSGIEEYVLEEGFLIVKNSSGIEKYNVSYSEILKINLVFVPGTKQSPEKYLCRIHTKNKKIVLSNLMFNSPVDIENQDESYKIFVMTLHEKINKYPSISYEKGTTTATYLFTKWGLLGGGIMLVFLGVVGIFIQKFQVTIVCGGAGIFILSIAKKFYKNYQPDIYNPEKINGELIP